MGEGVASRMVNLLFWIIFGAIAGWIGSIMAGATDYDGASKNILVGIFGALMGGFFVGLIGGKITEFNIYSLIVAIFGAIVLLFGINSNQRTQR